MTFGSPNRRREDNEYEWRATMQPAEPLLREPTGPPPPRFGPIDPNRPAPTMAQRLAAVPDPNVSALPNRNGTGRPFGESRPPFQGTDTNANSRAPAGRAAESANQNDVFGSAINPSNAAAGSRVGQGAGNQAGGNNIPGPGQTPGRSANLEAGVTSPARGRRGGRNRNKTGRARGGNRRQRQDLAPPNADTEGNGAVTSNFERHDFTKGSVLSLPYHVPHTNHGLNVDSEGYRECVRSTNIGHVYTKRRMFVVLYKNLANMVCLPLSTHSNRGFAGIPADLTSEHVCLKDIGAYNVSEFRNHAIAKKEIEFIKRRYDGHEDYGLSILTCIDLTAVFSTSWHPDIHRVGKLTRAAYERLIKYYDRQLALPNLARSEPGAWTAADGPVNPSP